MFFMQQGGYFDIIPQSFNFQSLNNSAHLQHIDLTICKSLTDDIHG